MADHFVGLNRGQEGMDYVDFTTGASTGSTDIEVRLGDAVAFTQMDVKKAMEAFERFFENRQQWAAAGFVIKG